MAFILKPVAGFEAEIALLWQAFVAGMCLPAVYDSIRIFRRIFPHGIIWISVEDLIFGLGAGSWLFLRACEANNGIIRGYMILGIGAGVLIYHSCCGRFVMKYLTKWIVQFKKQLKRARKAVTIRLDKLHRETEHEEKKKKTS